MDQVIAEYQKWKQQGQSLRGQAKQAMEERFRDLLTEAARLAAEYHQDFGAVLKPPPQITAFRYKAANIKAKRPAAAAKSASPKAEAPKPENPKLAPLEKRLALTKQKLEVAKTAGKPTRNLEDKIYEIEDAIRLAQSA
ncbi:MAG TPA: hypothetical protein VKB79_22800 [Bryobacteraceae bacterium]|nr:hypothetical protein [Bryobacteraceae bacterium]